MQIKVYNSCGDICFKLVAENDVDAAALGVFVDQGEIRQILVSGSYSADSHSITEINLYHGERQGNA